MPRATSSCSPRRRTATGSRVPCTRTATGSSCVEQNRPPTLAEQLTGKRSLTQVGRALDELGIRWIGARSPQAKGRVERLWGTLQDRLVTELRLAGAATLEDANAVLPRTCPGTTRGSPCRRRPRARLAADARRPQRPRRCSASTIPAGSPTTPRSAGRAGRSPCRADRDGRSWAGRSVIAPGAARRQPVGQPRGGRVPAAGGTARCRAAPGPPPLGARRGRTRPRPRAPSRSRAGRAPPPRASPAARRPPLAPATSGPRPVTELLADYADRFTGRRHPLYSSVSSASESVTP